MRVELRWVELNLHSDEFVLVCVLVAIFLLVCVVIVRVKKKRK